MASKDWKQISKDEYDLQWENKKSNIVSVFESVNGKWTMNVRNPNYTIKLERKFKTKSQALGYAKQYMRTH